MMANSWKNNRHKVVFMVKCWCILCFFGSALHAQNIDFQAYGKSIPELKQMLNSRAPSSARKPTLLFIPIAPVCSKPAGIPLFFSPGLAQWKPDNLPFFCKIEHQMGKKLPVQFKFRLGSVDYVDWLEGKGHGNY